MKPYEVSPGYMGLPRLFTTFSDDTPDVKRFAQVRSYQCSHLRADAHVGGPNLLTSEGIYHICCPRQSSDPFSVPYPIILFSRCGRRRCLVEAECTVSGGYAKIPKYVSKVTRSTPCQMLCTEEALKRGACERILQA